MERQRRVAIQQAFQQLLLRFGVDVVQDASRCRALLADLAADPVDDPTDDIELAVAACALCSRHRTPEALRNALSEIGLSADNAAWVTDLWRPALKALQALDLEPPTLVEQPGETVNAVSSEGRNTTDQADGTGTYTFLFTDIEGSTQHWERDAAKMRSSLALHDELLHEAVIGNAGRVFKHTGDGICAVFSSPLAAIEAAIEAQISFRRAPWSVDDGLRVRVGIHTGEATTRGDDFLGPALNRVGRLHAAAHGGQVILSAATELLVRHRLNPPTEIVHLGDHQLRDLPEPEAIFQASHPELRADFEDLRTEPTLTAELPIEVTSFLGRDDDIDNIQDRLGRARLVTLTGVGGVGKTRLCLQVAARTADRFEDGVRYCELAPIDSASDVLGAIVTSLDIALGPDRDDTERIVDWLRSRRLLLLLDNCEHVIEETKALVTQIVNRCERVTVLATSREALGVDGEYTWPVRPLDLPPPKTGPNEARLFEAVALFEERAQAVRPAFEIDAENVDDVLDICTRLDGVPLAIELAAARVRALSPSEISQHLGERFRLLGGKSLERRQTLVGTVDWSYDLLNDAQRLLFNRLAFFQDGFVLDAAIAVGVGPGVDVWDVLDILAELVDKSMVIADQSSAGSRYRMLETMRAYGLDKANDAAETDEIRQRLGDWARSVCETQGQLVRGPEERAAGARLDVELANIRSAHAAAVLAGDLDTAIGIVAALGDYTAVDLQYEVGRWAEQTLEAPGAAEHPDRYQLLGLAAYTDWGIVNYDRALARATESLELEKRFDRPKSWWARQATVNTNWFRGSYVGTEATNAYLSWADDALEDGNDFQRAWALGQLAVATALVDRTEANRALATEALELSRRLESPFLQALALYGNAEWIMDTDPRGALAILEEGLEIGRRSSRFSHGMCVSSVATLRGRIDDPADALPQYLEAFEVWFESGNWANQWILFRNLVELLPRLGEDRIGAVLFGAVSAIPEMNPPDLSPEGRRLGASVETMTSRLGVEAFRAAVDEGTRMESAAVSAMVRTELRRLSQA